MGTPGEQWLSLRAYQSDGPESSSDDRFNTRVPDWPEKGESIWSLNADNSVAWAIWPLNPQDSCITIEKVVPWGPFNGNPAWGYTSGPWKFCVPASDNAQAAR